MTSLDCQDWARQQAQARADRAESGDPSQFSSRTVLCAHPECQALLYAGPLCSTHRGPLFPRLPSRLVPA